MKIHLTSNRINIVLVGLLVLLGIGSFAYNHYLINRILVQERSNVELWAKAIEYTSNPIQEEISQNLLKASNYLQQHTSAPDSIIALIDQAEADRTSQTFVTQEILLSEERFQVPRIIVDGSGQIVFKHHVEGEKEQELIDRFAQMHDPIEINLGNEQYSLTQYVYYGESPTVRYLRYFPYIQLSLLALVLGIAFVSYRTITKSEQSNLWVGMTKEAAHQLGTPLSSLYGWVELLREEKDDDFTQRICNELENDVSRLRGVAERFNKIGSEPELNRQKLAPILENVLEYMKRRLPQLGKNVEVLQQLDEGVQAKVNSDLFQWAVENIIKNAMDAIKASASSPYVSVKLYRVENEVYIDVKDTGSGIDKKFHGEIFKPGYSTKKRGWGLGLSLTKRIIEEYHSGTLFIHESEVGRGTTMRIILEAPKGN
ncbi:Histidine kinase-, DNA gyrase B-, and HSP90-like ATPase [Fodinibius salinus]|uniref:histidine kinase n=1 Tax=Fodinibius salinus TaxID=860790 RepID=A0A5D3YML6_9BACT|nr:HAMP domain-containing sensor histidine kinase [Fodinibius salinus]TYP93931.1 Histidine kinase-, DNA gyrase B-, and HSP90-like ATPase [Fodinibius salinus]